MKPKPANRRVRRLRSKLEALAERGIDGEKVNAQKKLDRLLKRYDFKAPEVDISTMFRGTFTPSPISRWLCSFDVRDQDIAGTVKWSIEAATGLKASFRGDAVHVEADVACLPRLVSIASTIASGMRTLWERFERVPGVTTRDRALFLRGIYDGMMAEARTPGERLPERHSEAVKGRAKKRAVVPAPGIGVHPYSIAVDLGRQLRFEVPLVEIVGSLESVIEPKQIATPSSASSNQPRD